MCRATASRARGPHEAECILRMAFGVAHHGRGRVRVAEDAEHAALFAQPVGIKIEDGTLRLRSRRTASSVNRTGFLAFASKRSYYIRH